MPDTYVNMQDKYVNMQDIYVNMPDTYVNMQDNYVNMRDNYVNMRTYGKTLIVFKSWNYQIMHICQCCLPLLLWHHCGPRDASLWTH